MKVSYHRIQTIGLVTVLFFLSACGPKGRGHPPTPPPAITSYTIGGTVSGLTGTVVLQNNGGDDLTLSTNAAFTFATSVASGNTYNVTVLTQPSGQECSVVGGQGTVGSANVTSVAVSCLTKYNIGGTLSGLTGTVVLRNNGGDDLTLSTNAA